MYTVKVNEQFSFGIETDGDILTVNQEGIAVDTVLLASGHLHILHGNKSYRVELVSRDKDRKNAVVKVNGNTYEIAIEDRFDQLLKHLGMDSLTTGKLMELKAPMPGLVLDILVQEGQEVSKGDNLLILEAMKMENMIKASMGGVVKKILTSQGDKVEKNQVLIQFL